MGQEELSTALMTSAAILLVISIFGWLIAVGLQREADDLRRLRELPRKALGPEFSAIDLRSGRRIVSNLSTGTPTLILFVSPQCPKCGDVMEYTKLLETCATNVILVCTASEYLCRSMQVALPSGLPVFCDADQEIARAYGIYQFPALVVLDARRRIQQYEHHITSKSFCALMATMKQGSANETLPAVS
jgi:AhpC/TSA family